MLRLLFSTLTKPLDAISGDNLPMDIPGKDIPMISMIAIVIFKTNKFRRFVFLLFDNIRFSLRNDNRFNNGYRRGTIPSVTGADIMSACFFTVKNRIFSEWLVEVYYLGYVAIKNRVFENGNVIFIRGRTFHIGSVASALSRYVNAPV